MIREADIEAMAEFLSPIDGPQSPITEHYGLGAMEPLALNSR
jgi:hypothetical protein